MKALEFWVRKLEVFIFWWVVHARYTWPKCREAQKRLINKLLCGQETRLTSLWNLSEKQLFFLFTAFYTIQSRLVILKIGRWKRSSCGWGRTELEPERAMKLGAWRMWNECKRVFKKNELRPSLAPDLITQKNHNSFTFTFLVHTQTHTELMQNVDRDWVSLNCILRSNEDQNFVAHPLPGRTATAYSFLLCWLLAKTQEWSDIVTDVVDSHEFQAVLHSKLCGWKPHCQEHWLHRHNRWKCQSEAWSDYQGCFQQ